MERSVRNYTNLALGSCKVGTLGKGTICEHANRFGGPCSIVLSNVRFCDACQRM